MFFLCLCGFRLGSPVTSNLPETCLRRKTVCKRVFDRVHVHTVLSDGLVSHPGCVPASCPVVPGMGFGSAVTFDQDEALLKVDSKPVICTSKQVH